VKILFAILFVLLIFIFPQNIGAQELDRLQIFFHEIDADGEDVLNYYHITIPAWLTVENRALVIFTEIFNNINPEKMIYAPPNVSILGISFHAAASHLIINLSVDIMNYGGTHNEYMLIQKLLANAASMADVRYLTILIEGQEQYFPEGTLISLHYLTAPESK